MFLAREKMFPSTNRYVTTADDQIRLAFRWNIADISGNHSNIATMNYEDSAEVSTYLFLSWQYLSLYFYSTDTNKSKFDSRCT